MAIKTFKKLFLFLFFSTAVSFFATSAHAQKTTLPFGRDSLKVGVAGNAPFVIKEKGGEFAGIAVEIWEGIASKAGWKFKYVPFNTVNQSLAALDSGKIDLAVGPISITADRVTHLKFSQPFYQSSLAIVSRTDKPSFWERIEPFFSFKLVIAVGVFLVILGLVGTILWLAERKASPEQFPTKPSSGIANGMWLAIVTMSTTGYGDKAPITFWGRIIAGSWMVISIIFATSMVAGIASTLTLSGFGNNTITSAEQLSGKTAATIAGSPAEEFLKENSAKVAPVENLADAIAKLKNKEVNAVVYDRPQLMYFLKNNKDKKLNLSKAEYYKQGYGFAFPMNTEITHHVNVELLELTEHKKINRIITYWLGKEE
ncbi:polar amino acid transport system substrate-binding protein [Pedobacter sp. UYP30]|uniref:transporter substrate-binding domain-containing protein n=1 Tax=Pedobacter sp. UYP30 TaxID=1756400 RepID=UPI003398D7E2